VPDLPIHHQKGPLLKDFSGQVLGGRTLSHDTSAVTHARPYDPQAVSASSL